MVDEKKPKKVAVTNAKGQSYDKHLDKTFGKAGSNFFGDLGRWGDSTRNKFAGGAEQIADFSDGVASYVFGQPAHQSEKAPMFSPTGFFRAMADGAYHERPEPTSTRADMGYKAGDGFHEDKAAGTGYDGPYVPEADSGPKTLEDWIAYAQQLAGQAGGGFDYDAEIGRQQARGNENDQYLGAMYRALKNQTDAQRGNITAGYDRADAEVKQAGDVASANVSEAYQDSRAQDQQAAAALGFGNEIDGLQEHNRQDQAFNNASIQRNSAAAQTKLSDDEAAAQTMNTGWSNAAGLAGFEAQVANRRGMEDRVAGLTQQKAGAQDSRSSAILNLAMQLMGSDAAGQDKAWEHQQAEAEFLAKLQQQEQDNATRAQSSVTNNLLKTLGLYDDPAQGLEAYKTLRSGGLLQ